MTYASSCAAADQFTGATSPHPNKSKAKSIILETDGTAQNGTQNGYSNASLLVKIGGTTAFAQTVDGTGAACLPV
jgi:hypothetical protein